MPYCPTCKSEFPGDVKVCPDDNSALVGELPFHTLEGDGTTWVEIASTGNEDEANLLKGFLDSEGIAANIEPVKFTAAPIDFGTMGDIRIYVSAQDEQRAMELLRSREREYQKLDDEGETVVTDDGPASIDESAQAESDDGATPTA